MPFSTARLKKFPFQRVPYALEEKVAEQLRQMERDGIIERTKGALPLWCHPMMLTPKPDGSIRICIDPRYLNKFLIRAVYPFPNLERVRTHTRLDCHNVDVRGTPHSGIELSPSAEGD